jgi:hypothetical protein
VENKMEYDPEAKKLDDYSVKKEIIQDFNAEC